MLDNFSRCPYLPEQKSRIEYFFATAVTPAEFNEKLETGWRRFGYMFFRPDCEVCFQCIPLRVKVNEFVPAKSQRRVMRKNEKTRVMINKLRYTDEIFEIYKEHSRDRFNQDSTKEHFVESFYSNALSAVQSEYYIDEQLAGVGFIDISEEALSSVYFFYKTAYKDYSLGTYGTLREIELAQYMKLNYYYLGYYVRDNRSMCYKNHFEPFELYNWQTGKWEPGKRE